MEIDRIEFLVGREPKRRHRLSGNGCNHSARFPTFGSLPQNGYVSIADRRTLDPSDNPKRIDSIPQHQPRWNALVWYLILRPKFVLIGAKVDHMAEMTWRSDRISCSKPKIRYRKNYPILLWGDDHFHNSGLRLGIWRVDGLSIHD